MIFAHDTERALASAAALVNTQVADPDPLADPAGLAYFAKRWEWTGALRTDARELSTVRALRPRLRTFWQVDDHGAAELVNTMLREAHAMPRLVTHGQFGYHLHATEPTAPLADRLAVEAAMAMVDVLRQGELGRLHECVAADCSDVVVDLSKNRSRRFCDTTCANRTNVAAFRARRRNLR